jgi:hypothetical protein
MSNEKIIQIIPATGWYAHYKESKDAIAEGEPERFSVPLAMWALVYVDENVNFVTGLTSDDLLDGCLPCDDANFLRFSNEPID